MNTTIPTQRAGEPVCATARRPRRGVVSCALIGFGIGAGSATAYLLLDGEYLWGIPDWASVVFFPVFLAGFKFNELGLSLEASKAVGVLVVGVAYAVLAALTRSAWFALKHRRQSAALRRNSE